MADHPVFRGDSSNPPGSLQVSQDISCPATTRRRRGRPRARQIGYSSSSRPPVVPRRLRAASSQAGITSGRNTALSTGQTATGRRRRSRSAAFEDDAIRSVEDLPPGRRRATQSAVVPSVPLSGDAPLLPSVPGGHSSGPACDVVTQFVQPPVHELLPGTLRPIVEDHAVAAVGVSSLSASTPAFHNVADTRASSLTSTCRAGSTGHAADLSLPYRTTHPDASPIGSSVSHFDRPPSFSAEQVARRREISLGKRPNVITQESTEFMPPVSHFASSVGSDAVLFSLLRAGEPSIEPYVDSSDDEAFGWPVPAGDFDGPSSLSNATTEHTGPSFLQQPSASCSSAPPLPSWLPLIGGTADPESHPSSFYLGCPDDEPAPDPSDVELDESDEHSDELLVVVAPVAATPFVPRNRIVFNQRARRSIRRHRRRVRAGYKLTDLELPLPQDLVQFLKRTWPKRSYYGGPHFKCQYCSANFWYQERCKRLSTKKRVVYTRCCRCGKISLPAYPDWPSPLAELLHFDGNADCNRFLRLIREYNSMFAFTSLGVHVDKSVNVGRGPYVFKICGVVCHEIGSLLPPEDNPIPKFAQLYIFDTQNEINHRMSIFSSAASNVDENRLPSTQFASSSRSRTAPGDESSVQPESASSAQPRQRPERDKPDPRIVDSLRVMLNTYNSLVQTFRMAEARLFSPDAPEVAIQLFGHEGTDHGNRYSLPTVSELAALIVDDFSVEVNRFDVIVQKESGPFQRVSPLNPSLMALQYPLMFPHASMGFHLGIKYQAANDAPVHRRQNVTMLEYYCYRFHYRMGEPNPFTCCGRLSHQIEVDSYSCVESSRLSFHFWNQDVLRSESYQGISDAVGEGNSFGKNIGVEYILPSSYTGSPRYMIQNYQDGMAICRVHGAPDLFVTFTCNPKWDEISDTLLMEPGQIPSDRPDIVTRVFKMKIDEFTRSVRKGKTFGPVDAYLYVVEFQKRGLPHIHSLVWLKLDTDNPTAETIDSFISAEIPDYKTDALAYSLVEEFMVHGPCGEYNSKSPCMKDGKCSKHYPKEYNEETTIDGFGFPVYRRRNNGCFVMKNGIPLDNRWIVPHNVPLLKRFQAHINVEWCNKTNLLKYLFKYLAKGHDMSRARTRSIYESADSNARGINEIDEYAKCRYLSTCEAGWRTFAFDIHVREPSVHRLAVHLPNMNRVIYSENDNLANVLQNPNKYKTMLTEWFTANRQHHDARALTYLQFPSKWVWNGTRKVWKRRKPDDKKLKKFGPPIGRIYNCHPTTKELYFLRLLLNEVPGATCFEDLKSYRGVLYNSFKEACHARGLVGDDREWFLLFDESIQWASSYQLRHLYMTVLLFCEVTNGQKILDKYWKYMSDDLSRRIIDSMADANFVSVPPDYLYSYLLEELSMLFAKNGYSLSSFGISTASVATGRSLGNRLLLEEMQHDVNKLRATAVTLHEKLNACQKGIYDQIIASVNSPVGKVFFVSGHGGTGKTFLWNAVITALRAEDRIVLAVASSGVASLLLPGGRTAHSRFRIPLEIGEHTMCNISRGTNLAELVQKASLILWDEAPMTHRRCFEAVNRSMKDIMSADDSSKRDLPFGGKTVVLGGDFRQVLPVVEGAARSEIINYSLIKSPLWQHVTLLKLEENMRLSNPLLSNEEKIELDLFARWVLSIGDGTVAMSRRGEESYLSWLTLPEDIAMLPTSDYTSAIANEVYDAFSENYSEYFNARKAN